MKTVFLHGLGQTAHDWDAVLSQAGLSGAVCTAGGETDIYRTADRF